METGEVERRYCMVGGSHINTDEIFSEEWSTFEVSESKLHVIRSRKKLAVCKGALNTFLAYRIHSIRIHYFPNLF